MAELNFLERLLSPIYLWEPCGSIWRPPGFNYVLEYVTSQALRIFRDIDDPSRVIIHRNRIATNPVLRFTFRCPHQPAMIVAKWCFADASNNEGLAERDNFRSFNGDREGDVLACPTVLGFLPDFGVVVTFFEPGTVFLRELTAWRGWRGSRRLTSERAGSWLARFHSIRHRRATLDPRSLGVRSISPVFVHEPDEYLTRLLRQFLGPLAVDQMFSLFRYIRENDGGIVSDIGAFHGDFGPANILYSRERLVVLDAARHHDGPQLVDLAGFWADSLICGKLRGMSWPAIKHVHSAFLRSYQLERPPDYVNKPVLAAFKCAILARHLARHDEHLNGILSPVRRLARIALASIYRNAFAQALDSSTSEQGPGCDAELKELATH